MKIRYMSDLHLEFEMGPDQIRHNTWPYPSIGEDVVVLAGDIHQGVDGIYWAQQAFKSRPVLYVLGNHEFYGHDWDQLIIEARAAAVGSNITFLEQDAVVIDGIRFLGCSLWTDFRLWGPDRERQAMGKASRKMNDYHVIKRGGRRLTPPESVERHRHSVEWLKAQLSDNVPTVVVTHHAPTEQTVNPDYRCEILNSAYHSKLDELIAPPVIAWIHGHTHYSVVERVNGIPVLVNTAGYPGQGADRGFSWKAVLEIEDGVCMVHGAGRGA